MAACYETRDFQAVYTRVQVAPRFGFTLPGGVVQYGRQRLLSPEPPLSRQERAHSPETQSVNIRASIIWNCGPNSCNSLPQYLRNDELSYQRFLSGQKSPLFRISYDCTA